MLRKPKRLLPLLVALCALSVALALAIRFIGTWLVTEDPLTPALASVVFGGQVPFRAIQAAAFYNEGTVNEVWLTQGSLTAEDLKLRELGLGKPAEYELSREVLRRLGVPESAIHVLPGENANTADEVRTIFREANSRSITSGTPHISVILVTSKSHSRRVKVLWHTLAPKNVTALVRFSSDDTYEPAAWWKTSGDASQVAHEWFGLLNAWVGFPLSSRRR